MILKQYDDSKNGYIIIQYTFYLIILDILISPIVYYLGI